MTGYYGSISAYFSFEVIPIELPAGTYSSGLWLPEIRQDLSDFLQVTELMNTDDAVFIAE
jgi:hypothetical protein